MVAPSIPVKGDTRLKIDDKLPVHIDVGTLTDDERLRRRAYGAAASLGIIVILVIWWVRATEESLTLFDMVSYPLLIVVCLWLVWALLSGRFSLTLIGRVAFGVFTAYHIGYVVAAFAGSWTLFDVRLSLGETHYWNMTISCMLAFLLYDTRTSLKLTAGIFGATVALTWFYLLKQMGAGLPGGYLAGVVKLQLSSGMLLSLVYAFGYMKDQLAKAQSAARDMAYLAHTDPLTRVHNRRWLYRCLVDEVERSTRYHRPLSLIMIDLDHFKEINDTQGHPVGDTVLSELTHVLQKRIRHTDQLGRWGGEEFMVICPETDLDAAGELAERLRSAVQHHAFPDVESVTASFGVVALEPEESVDQFVSRADQSLYRAKHSGRNRVEVAG